MRKWRFISTREVACLHISPSCCFAIGLNTASKQTIGLMIGKGSTYTSHASVAQNLRLGVAANLRCLRPKQRFTAGRIPDPERHNLPPPQQYCSKNRGRELICLSVRAHTSNCLLLQLRTRTSTSKHFPVQTILSIRSLCPHQRHIHSPF